MGARVFYLEEDNICGYTFTNQRRRKMKINFPPKPYSKLNSFGEEIILTKEEVEAWTKAYYQAVEELGVDKFTRNEKVYNRVDEILRETGNYRFL